MPNMWKTLQMWWKIRMIHSFWESNKGQPNKAWKKFGLEKKIKCAWKNEEFHCIKLKKLRKKANIVKTLLYFPKEYKIHEKLPWNWLKSQLSVLGFQTKDSMKSHVKSGLFLKVCQSRLKFFWHVITISAL